MSPLLQELKRRKIFRVAGVYAVAAWIAIQVISVVLPTFNVPQWVNQTLILLILLGFPATLLLTWAFDITSEGIQKAEPAAPGQLKALRTRDYVFGTSIVLLIGLLGAQQFGMFSGNDQPDAAAVITEKSVAVLPFVAISSGPDDGYFADGLTEELLNVLAQFPDLKVPGRTSSFYYKGQDQDLRVIGEALGVAHILEGSVRRSADTLRITAQLVDAATGFHLWSGTFDRSSNDIFDIQDEIAGAVTDALRVQLFGDDASSQLSGGTRNAEAHNLYLIAMARLREQRTGLVQSNPEPMGRTRTMFEEITRLDPDFAEAWTGLTLTLLRLSSEGLTEGTGIMLSRAEGLAQARAALARAQALAPNSPETLLATAAVNNSARLSGLDASTGITLESVMDDYERVLELAPENVDALDGLASLHISQRDYPAAVSLYDRILAVDPLSPAILSRGNALRDSNPELARRQIRQAGDLYPASNWQFLLGHMEMHQGHLHHAALYYDKQENNTLSPTVLLSLGDLPGHETAIARRVVMGGEVGDVSSVNSLLYRRDYAAVVAHFLTSDIAAIRLQNNVNSLRAAHFRLRQFEEALQVSRQSLESAGRDWTDYAALLTPGQIGNAIEVAHALHVTGDTATADTLRARVRQLLTETYDPDRSIRDKRLLHEANLLLLASEGRVEESLTEMEAMIAAHWRLLSGIAPNIVDGHLMSNSHYWLEDNPLIDSIRNEPRFIAALDFVKAENAAMLAQLQAGLTLEDIADEL